MNVPAIAKQTFDLLRNNPVFLSISQSISLHLSKIKDAREKARFLHNVVDEYNQEVFSHPLLKTLVPCKSGCSACCHTQVSATYEEALLLSDYLNEGMKIDLNRLKIQAQKGQDSSDYYQLSFNERKCVFLDDGGNCRVYRDRPMVCRTNAVIGDSRQCDPRLNDSGQLRLVKTEKADMAIVAGFASSSETGTLPQMLQKILNDQEENQSQSARISKVYKKLSLRNLISKSL